MINLDKDKINQNIENLRKETEQLQNETSFAKSGIQDSFNSISFLGDYLSFDIETAKIDFNHHIDNYATVLNNIINSVEEDVNRCLEIDKKLKNEVPTFSIDFDTEHISNNETGMDQTLDALISSEILYNLNNKPNEKDIKETDLSLLLEDLQNANIEGYSKKLTELKESLKFGEKTALEIATDIDSILIITDFSKLGEMGTKLAGYLKELSDKLKKGEDSTELEAQINKLIEEEISKKDSLTNEESAILIDVISYLVDIINLNKGDPSNIINLLVQLSDKTDYSKLSSESIEKLISDIIIILDRKLTKEDLDKITNIYIKIISTDIKIPEEESIYILGTLIKKYTELNITIPEKLIELLKIQNKEKNIQEKINILNQTIEKTKTNLNLSLEGNDIKIKSDFQIYDNAKSAMDKENPLTPSESCSRVVQSFYDIKNKQTIVANKETLEKYEKQIQNGEIVGVLGEGEKGTLDKVDGFINLTEYIKTIDDIEVL